jgi:hypothetical protein
MTKMGNICKSMEQVTRRELFFYIERERGSVYVIDKGKLIVNILTINDD